MKKLIGMLTVVAFMAVNIAVAQTSTPAKTAPSKTEKKEVTAMKSNDAKVIHKKGKHGHSKVQKVEASKMTKPAAKPESKPTK